MSGSLIRLLIMLLAIWALSCATESSQDPGESETDTSAVAQADTNTPADEMTTELDSVLWSESPIRTHRTVSEVAVVGAIRAGAHADYDRFVIEFENGIVPGHEVKYLDGDPHECGSGGFIDLDGAAALEVRLEPARGYSETGESTVDHAQRDHDLRALKESEISCDFEAVFSAVLGVAGRRPIRVVELEDPARLVVDIKHTVE